jgi:succinoglycan biosynthesis transport protein ExoP
MSDLEYEADASGPSLNDILFILFRHKWKILLCATAGMVAAVAAYFLLPTVYKSEAKLLVRYVVDKSAVDVLDPSVRQSSADSMNLINSEVEILTSQDLIMQVAQAVGIEQLLQTPDYKGAGSKMDGSVPEPEVEATQILLQNLQVTAVKETNIISVSYKNIHPAMAVRVLQELVSRYFDKHLEVHRSTGAFEFVRRETDQLRSQLNQTETEQKELDDQAGIISPAQTEANLTAELTKAEDELSIANAELAAQKARVQRIVSGLAWAQVNQSDSNAPLAVSSDTNQQYQALVSRLTRLRQIETELLATYRPENPKVKVVRSQIADVEKLRGALEEKYPGLLDSALAGSPSQTARHELVTEKAQLLALEAKTEALATRVNGIRERFKRFSELRAQLADLGRRKEVEETNYKYFQSSLERARIDETLDPSRMPNISVVQKPLTAEKYSKDKRTLVLSLAFGGWAIGIAIALLKELLMDRTVKRRVELETRLSIPLVLSIPYFNRIGHSPLALCDKAEESSEIVRGGAPKYQEFHDHTVPNTALWNGNEFIRPFCDAIRDRMILDFELNAATHRPKLVAVTSCSDGAGASTLAKGLATSLLETHEKIILVDHLFVEKIATTRKSDKRRLITSFEGSDFDYVIYDLPCLSDISPTLALAGFMDKVLFVVEAEKSDREVVKRAYSQLVAVNAKVSVILNKSRSYGPKWLRTEV